MANFSKNFLLLNNLALVLFFESQFVKTLNWTHFEAEKKLK